MANKEKEFAVIKTGGKQYQVSVGDELKIEKIPEKSRIKNKIIFDKVMLVDNGQDTTIGTPYIKEARVEAVILTDGKGKKVTVIQYKSKSRYFKKKGHRQPFTSIKITAIK